MGISLTAGLIRKGEDLIIMVALVHIYIYTYRYMYIYICVCVYTVHIYIYMYVYIESSLRQPCRGWARFPDSVTYLNAEPIP